MEDLARLPAAMVEDRRLDPTAKYLYIAIQVLKPKSLSELARKTGIDDSKVSRCCDDLTSKGWIFKAKHGTQVKPVLAIPSWVQDQLMLEARAGLAVAASKLEFIFVRILKFVIEPTEVLEHVRPQFLINPKTGNPMEYDVFLPKYLVAFEAQGRQHFVRTPLHKSDDEFIEARCRDLMKKGLSLEENVTLIEITADDLSIEGVLKKLPDCIPRADFDPNCRYAQVLNQMGDEYRASLTRGVRREQGGRIQKH